MVASDVTWAIVMFMALRTLTARLLAVRIGPIGAGLAAALAVAGGIGAQHAIAAGTGSSPGREAAAYLVFAGLSLLITMTAVATLGLLSGPAATPNRVLSGIPHPLRQLRARVDRSRRYVGLLWLGARHGLGPLSGLRRSRDPGTSEWPCGTHQARRAASSSSLVSSCPRAPTWSRQQSRWN